MVVFWSLWLNGTSGICGAPNHNSSFYKKNLKKIYFIVFSVFVVYDMWCVFCIEVKWRLLCLLWCVSAFCEWWLFSAWIQPEKWICEEEKMEVKKWSIFVVVLLLSLSVLGTFWGSTTLFFGFRFLFHILRSCFSGIWTSLMAFRLYFGVFKVCFWSFLCMLLNSMYDILVDFTLF